jgi:hypothetical protein
VVRDGGIIEVNIFRIGDFDRPIHEQHLALHHRCEVFPADPVEVHGSASMLPGGLFVNHLVYAFHRILDGYEFEVDVV